MASQYPPSPKITIPEPGVWPLRTTGDWRDALHRLTNVFVPLLVTYSVVSGDFASLWVPAILAAVDPLFSTLNAVDKTRKIIYGVGFLVQTGLFTYGILDEQTASLIVGTVVSFVTSYIASKFTTPGTITAA